MKKITSILLTVVLLAAMLSVFSVPAAAANTITFMGGEINFDFDIHTGSQFSIGGSTDTMNIQALQHILNGQAGDITLEIYAAPGYGKNLQLEDDFTVPEGKTVILHNSITVVNGAGIYLKSGSTLKLDGATIEAGRCNHGEYEYVMSYIMMYSGSKLCGSKNKNVTSKLLNFQHHGFYGGGGAIYAEDNCVIENIQFDSCCNVVDGGAILVSGENCKIDSCSFSKCYSSDSKGDGGAIYVNDNDCVISNCTFNSCESRQGYGGAIYVNDKNCNITNCTFNNCTCPEDGGAICIEGGNCDITGCTFYFCECDDEGGAIFVGEPDSDITHCTFDNCHAKTAGGAIYVYHYNTFVDYCDFLYCASCEYEKSYGGAIAAYSASGVARWCKFINNLASIGGAYANYGTSFYPLDCIFSGNWCTRDKDDVFSNCKISASCCSFYLGGGRSRERTDHVSSVVDTWAANFYDGEWVNPEANNSSASIISNGSIAIICSVLAVAAIAVAVLVIVKKKKKKKPALAEGADNTDEE